MELRSDLMKWKTVLVGNCNSINHGRTVKVFNV